MPRCRVPKKIAPTRSKIDTARRKALNDRIRSSIMKRQSEKHEAFPSYDNLLLLMLEPKSSGNSLQSPWLIANSAQTSNFMIPSTGRSLQSFECLVDSHTLASWSVNTTLGPMAQSYLEIVPPEILLNEEEDIHCSSGDNDTLPTDILQPLEPLYDLDVAFHMC